MNKEYHIPALLHQTVDGINIKPDGIYIDATFGGGGHSALLLSKLTTGQLIAFDQDLDAHKNAFNDKKFTLFHSNFAYIQNFLDYLKIDGVDGIIADLGLSTHHIDVPERGFSFRFDAPLDMRMNTNQEFDAKKLINNYKEADLRNIFKNYGELNNAHQLAVAISKARRQKELKTTFDLVKAFEKFIPKKTEHKFLAKIFQAIRIEVNNEIGTLEKFLLAIPGVLNDKGRAAIISYHSLEDKLVKNFFRTGNLEGKRITDMYGNVIRPLEPINNKVIVPDDLEIDENNRARSAKLRIAEKNTKNDNS
nr:16S rRNA (cytosine(1402)-N(4))-methyltransferase RsmH [Bacteroidales bacterium]